VPIYRLGFLKSTLEIEGQDGRIVRVAVQPRELEFERCAARALARFCLDPFTQEKLFVWFPYRRDVR
jgi:hypothetical protein